MRRVPFSEHEVERHARRSVDPHMAMHHYLRIGVCFSDALVMCPAFFVPSSILASASIMCAMPDVFDSMTVFFHDLFVVPFLTTVKNMSNPLGVPFFQLFFGFVEVGVQVTT